MVVMASLLSVERVEGGVLASLYFLHSPRNMTVRQGEDVLMQCEAAPSDKVTDCQWTRDALGLGGMHHLPRHTMEGCNLAISTVQPEDAGEYKCQVGGRGVAPIISLPARLQVMVEPGMPSIMEAREGDWVEVEQGGELLLTCQSRGGSPHAELHWKDEHGDDVLGNAVETITRIEDTSSFKTVSILRFNPIRPMTVSCTAHSESFPDVKKSRDLRVQLRMKVVEEVVSVNPGGSVRLFCGQDNGAYKWFLNDREIEGETGSSLVIEDFTEQYDNSIVKCLQEKFGGESRLLKLVRLRNAKEGSLGIPRRGPRHEEPQTLPSTNGKKMFICVTEEEDSPSPEFVWVDGKMIRSKQENTSGGKVKCKVVSGGFKKMEQMENKFKQMNKDIRRFSKIIRMFTQPQDIP